MKKNFTMPQMAIASFDLENVMTTASTPIENTTEYQNAVTNLATTIDNRVDAASRIFEFVF